jgi:high-affinity nickel-transport protein
MLVTATACLLGFANGMRHALEPDHLAAVSTVVAGERSAKESVRYAAAWGAGHATMLVVAAGGLHLMRARLSDGVSDALELVVAVLLVGLGIRGLAKIRRVDDGHSHTSSGSDGRRPLVRLPFAIGLVHGLAGSGALAALVALHVASPAFALSFIAIYAIGAAVGMATLAGVLGWPLARLARAPRFVPVLVGVSAIASLAVGIAWATPILVKMVG